MPESTAAAWIDQLSDLELEHMAQLYVNSNATAGRAGKWLQVAALRLDSRRLVRLSRFFGYNEVYAAIVAMNPSKLNAFSALTTTAYPPPVAGAPLRTTARFEGFGANGHSTVTPMGFTPSGGMTIPELYAGFRSMQVGSMAAEAAIYETATYAGKHLVVAWGLGYGFGSLITTLMQDYAPNFYYDTFVPSVGGTIAKTVDWTQNFVLDTYTKVTQGPSVLGPYQAQTLPTMGVPSAAQSTMGNMGGDFQLEYEYETYTGGGGSCRPGLKCPPVYPL